GLFFVPTAHGRSIGSKPTMPVPVVDLALRSMSRAQSAHAAVLVRSGHDPAGGDRAARGAGGGYDDLALGDASRGGSVGDGGGGRFLRLLGARQSDGVHWTVPFFWLQSAQRPRAWT